MEMKQKNGNREWCYSHVVLVAIFVLSSVAKNSSLFAQFERRNQLKTPGLCIQSEFPYAAVNLLKIHNGKLYVASQDQTVRAYPWKDGILDSANMRIYRWPAWREERGQVFALDFSPDGKNMVVGGKGMRYGDVCEISLESGELLRSWPPNAAGRDVDRMMNSISSLTYDTDSNIWIGSVKGQVGIWKQDGTFKTIVQSTPASNDKNALEYVLASAVVKNQVWIVRSDGKLLRFNSTDTKFDSLTFPQFKGQAIDAWIDQSSGLIGIVEQIEGVASSRLSVWDPTTGKIPFNHVSPSNIIFQKIRFDHVAKKWFALGQSVDRVPEKTIPKSSSVYQLVGKDEIKPYLSYPDSFATTISNPVDGSLAVSFDFPTKIQMYRKEKLEQPAIYLGANPIENVTYFDDLNGFEWESKENNSIQHYSFNLSTKKLTSETLQSSILEKSIAGTGLIFDFSHSSSFSYVSPTGEKSELRIETGAEIPGRSAAMLPREKELPWIAVGHQWGATVFDTKSSQRMKPIRKLIGHQGQVTSIASSSDNNFVLTGGTDGSIACFSLKPWKFQANLGVSFRIDQNQLVVDEVDLGSPGWEAGLTSGDRIQQLYYSGVKIEKTEEQKRLLADFEPGIQFQFSLSRAGVNQSIAVETRVLQRPLWKFYRQGNEWLLWRWRDYFYDCSTQGDTLLGWQINNGFDRTPIFLKAEQARERFHKPEKLKDLMKLLTEAPNRAAAPDLVPPHVKLNVKETDSSFLVDANLDVEENALLVGEPSELSIWVSDYRVKKWVNPKPPFHETVEIKKSELRTGTNRIIARAYSRERVRGDSELKSIVKDRSPVAPRLWALAVGINDYSASGEENRSRGGMQLRNLTYAVKDAMSIESALKLQNGAFDDLRVVSLLDRDARNDTVFNAMSSVAQKATPDDWFVLSLAGHGYSWPAKDDEAIESFMFLTANSRLVDERDALASSLSVSNRLLRSQDGIGVASLFEGLSQIPCRKLILVDACHSGGAAEVIRLLTPDFQVGPTVMVAARKNQHSQESPLKLHGIFTHAILEALSNKFKLADRNDDQRLSSAELYNYCAQRVPQLFSLSIDYFDKKDRSIGQEPEFWAPAADANIPIFKKSSDFLP